MKKRMRRFLSSMMAFLMVLVSLPVPGLKVHATENYGVWIGDTEFTSDDLVIEGESGTAAFDSVTGTVTFNDFEGVKGKKDDCLIYTNRDITLSGKAVISGDDTAQYGIYAYACDITFSEDADISVDMNEYGVYGMGTDAGIYVRGKLDVTAGKGATNRSGMEADKIYVQDGSVSVNMAGSWASGIKVGKEMLMNSGSLTVKANMDDSCGIGIHQGAELTICGGETLVCADGKNGIAIGGKSSEQGDIYMTGGKTNLSASGEGGYGIRLFTTGRFTMTGGEIMVSSYENAIHSDQELVVSDKAIFKAPYEGGVSGDKKNIVDKFGNVVTQAHIVIPQGYEVWLGGTEINSENCTDIPGLTGGGHASFDPATYTLRFDGDVTGVESLYDSIYGKTILYSSFPLTIEGDAALADEHAVYGICAGGTDASLVINGNISAQAAKCAVYSEGELTINGTLNASNTDDSADYTVRAQKLFVKGGNLTINGKIAHDNVLEVSMEISMMSGSISVNNTVPASSIPDGKNINCFGTVNIFGGTLWSDSSYGYALHVGDTLLLDGGQVDLIGSRPDGITLFIAHTAEITGGRLNVTSEKGGGISCADMYIAQAVVNVVSKKAGISCTGTFSMDSGILESRSEEAEALVAATAITLKPGQAEITIPANGKAVGDTILESDNTTRAKWVRIEGEVSYPVWVGSKQVNMDNKDAIPVEGGGSASYDDVTKTLTFSGNVSGVSGLYDLAGTKVAIYTLDPIGLVISGNAALKNADADMGIFADGGTLTIKDDVEISSKNEALVNASGGILIEGEVTAANNSVNQTVKCAGDLTLNGKGLHAKNSGTGQAIFTNGRLILKAGVLEAESKDKAIQAEGTIDHSAGYEPVIPDNGRYSDDEKSVDEYVPGEGYVPAKKVRLEKLDKYDLYVGGQLVTSLNKDNVPGLKSGSASYNAATHTLTFKGAVIEDQLDEYKAAIYSGESLIIEGDVSIDTSEKEGSYALRTEGELTVNGTVTAKADFYGVYAGDADLNVNGKLVAKGDKAAVTAKKLVVDGGSLSANVSNAYTKSDAILTSGDVELKSGSITALSSAEKEAGGINAGGKVTITGGSMLIQKTEKGGTALYSFDGIYVEGGSLDIICAGVKHYTSFGIKDSFLCVNGGSVNITVKGMACTAISSNGINLDVHGGSLTVSSELTQAIKCSKFVMDAGSVNVSAGLKGIVCALYMQSGGEVSVDAGKTAVECTDFDISAGSFAADAKDGTAAIVATGMATKAAEVEIVKPAGGEIKKVGTAPDPEYYTVVGSGDAVASSVLLYAPAKYNVWVGSTQVTDLNKSGIEVEGGSVSYDPAGKTLRFNGSVSGVKEMDASFHQIFASDQDLTVCGTASLLNEDALSGIEVYNGNLTILGNIDAFGKEGAIMSTGTVTVSGNVSARGGNATVGALDASDSLILESGTLTVSAANATTCAAIVTNNLKVNGGKLVVEAEGTRAVSDALITVKGGSVKISGKDALDTSTLTVEGGNIDVRATDKAINLSGAFSMKGGTLRAATESGSALVANGGITIEDTHEITDPVEGKISADGKSIVTKDDATTKVVKIEKKGVKYTVSFNMCEHGTAIEPQTVPEGETVAEPTEPSAAGFTFRGWYTSADYAQLYDFNTPVTSDLMLYAKWTENAASELISISINKAPSKTVYRVGESFDPTGMTVSANYSDSKDNRLVTDYDWSPSGALSLSDTVIIISYSEGGITKTASQNIVVKDSSAPIPDDEQDLWNLFEDAEYSFEISALSAGGDTVNTNVKSAKFYDAVLNGNTISVKLKNGVDRKKAAKPANTVLEFRLPNGSAVTYVMPVQYVKPVFKLSISNVTIRKGADSEVTTKLLYKTAGGNFEPYDLTYATVKVGGQEAIGDADGEISITTNMAMSGISVKEEDWESAVDLKFNVKAVDKDVLSVDLKGAKNVVLNTQDPDATYSFKVTLNGKDVTAADGVKVSCKKAEGLAVLDTDGWLQIGLPAAGAKKGTYTIKLEYGKAKASVKVKVSDKSLDSAIGFKIQSRYDVVTHQKMVVVPVYKEAGMEIKDVSSSTSFIEAELNDAGNIVIDYTGTALNAKQLKIGDIALTLELDGVADPVTVTLRNVKAKKSAPKVKAGVVNLSRSATGEIKGSVNIISTYKDASGHFHNIAPKEVTILDQKKAVAEKNALDMTEIDIKSMDAKSGSVKVKLTYPGDVSKTVTIKVKNP
ncbi:MAG: carbohydrate-binding domain-containing protein [Lachnospiraceae bacterium]|nr:carbohydrate-binding domain-containing protein [Lachnospiraceae bacterium]